MRDRASESIQMSLTRTPPFTDSIKERSNVALWAITGQPPTNSSRAATASSAEGASITSASVMLVSFVISGGMGTPGCTNVSKRSTISRPRRRAAEISIRLLSCKDNPVVSVSRTMTSSSIRPNDLVFARSASVEYDSITQAGVPGNTASLICMNTAVLPRYLAARSSAISTRRVQTSLKAMFAWTTSSGYSEADVMPGMVLVSRMIGPLSVTIKSLREMPKHPNARWARQASSCAAR